MNILAKSAPITYEIEDKIKKGCSGIEIQLLKDFLNENIPAKFYFDKISAIKDVDVKVLHMPLVDGTDIYLEFFNYPVYKSSFVKAVELAQMLGDYFNHNVILVIHSGFSMKQFEHIPILLDFITELFKEAIEKHSRIEFAFENVLPINLDLNSFPHTRNGFLYDNVDLANYFNNKFNTNIFGTVFDTCHYMVSEKIFKSVFADTYPMVLDHISLEEFFIRNKDVIKLFHLASVVSLGYTKFEHGYIFKEENEEDINFLNDFFNLYHKYADNVYVTLEVCEADYSNAVNYLSTKALIDKYFNKY